MAYRSQSCSVESFLSDPLPVAAGVPQGSILGPMYYCIFTNDFPEVVHQRNCPAQVEINEFNGFNMQCSKCGGVTVYADDSTYSVSDSNYGALSDKISNKFDIMAEYLTANKLKVNSDKTHILVMCSEQRSKNRPTVLSMNA